MSYEPLHHKYRPKNFAELVGQDAIATTLSNAIRTDKIAPAYLFTGPRGTGKTSSARILAKSLNCLSNNKPTEQPCGVCQVCQAIANGSALDVIEIDAASNTGVDNIREIIERAQFAPVQCRYKVYVVDECLTGDSLVQTSDGLVRIDNPHITGKQVLSYNDFSKTWEFKKVVRWLDQGKRQILVIKTTNREIRCTANHLISTESGWTAAKDLREGAKILSPVNVAKDIPLKKTKSLPTGLPQRDILQQQSFTKEGLQARSTTTPEWAQIRAGSGWQTSDSIPSLPWNTSLEQVESVKVAGIERVYDLEIEENHNFVANGLLVHNCHMLSTAAFNSLLKTLEEPPNRVVFVLATTDPQRVLPTIISRCQRFDFRRIPLEAMVAHLSAIANRENINITPEAVRLVAQVAQGGLRDAESLLDQLSLLSGQVSVERVWDLVGSCSEPDLVELLQAIAQNRPEAVLDCTRRVLDRGREPLTVLQNLAGFYRDLLIAKTSPNRDDLVAITPPTWKALCELARLWDIPTILLGQKHLKDSEVQVKQTTQPRLWLEVTLLGLLPVTNSQSVAVPVIPAPIQPAERSEPNRSSSERIPSEPIMPVIAATNKISESEKIPSKSADMVSAQASTPETAASPTPQEQPTAPREPTTADTSKEDIWQQVLDHLQPPATQALLKQQGHLLAFNGAVARIGINSQSLLKLAQGKLPNIEAAFQKLLQRKVRVTLELGTPPQTKTAPSKEVSERSPQPSVVPTPVTDSTAPQLPRGNSSGAPVQAQGKACSSPNDSTALAETTRVKSWLPPSTSQIQKADDSRFQSEMLTSTESLRPPELEIAELPATDTNHIPTTTTESEEDVMSSAQQLAKAFSGEVIGLNLESTFPDISTNDSLPSAIPVTSWAEGEDEDEIEF